MPLTGYGPSPSQLCLQATRANEIFPAKVHLRKWGRQNNTVAEINNKCFNLQTSKCFKQQMFIKQLRGSNANTKDIKGTNAQRFSGLRAASRGSVRQEKIHEVFGKDVGGNVRHLRIRDLSKSQRIRHQALIPIEGSDGD
jgi:hypothetical protein